MDQLTPFDAAEYLDDEEAIEAFLQEASEGNDPGVIALALGAVARARNVSQLARDTGMTRAGLYKALSQGGNPSLETVAKIADVLGFRLALAPKVSAAKKKAKTPEAIEPTAPAKPARGRRAAAMA